jgi:hypothetical protein
MACQATTYGRVFAAGDAPRESQFVNAIHHMNLNAECLPDERLIRGSE